jgi:palmitoyltransferase ZDHHC9/14/18
MPLFDAGFIERACGVERRSKREERLVDEDRICCGRPQYVGRMILLCGRKDSRFPFQCLVGPDWPCMLITYALVSVPTIFFLVLVAARISWIIVVLGLVSFILTLVSFSLTACSDPGIVYRQLLQEEALEDAEAGAAQGHGNGSSSNGNASGPPSTALAAAAAAGTSTALNPATQIPCSRCELSRPVGASHCYDCEVCITDLDHHCPWTGKCIGKKNLYFFYSFLTCLTLHIIFVGCVTGMSALNDAFDLNGGNP